MSVRFKKSELKKIKRLENSHNKELAEIFIDKLKKLKLVEPENILPDCSGYTIYFATNLDPKISYFRGVKYNDRCFINIYTDIDKRPTYFIYLHFYDYKHSINSIVEALAILNKIKFLTRTTQDVDEMLKILKKEEESYV